VAPEDPRAELEIVNSLLVDTGPLVAYLDTSDPAHDRVSEYLDSFRGQLLTSCAVITETMYFLAGHRNGPRVLSELVAGSGMEIYNVSRPPELHEAVSLMEKYSDVPMDFADATLVLLAEGLDAHEILTLDRRGFSTYRTRENRHLHMILDAT